MHNQGGYIQNAYNKTVSLPVAASNGLTVVGTHFGENVPGRSDFVVSTSVKSRSEIFVSLPFSSTAWVNYIVFCVA